MLKTKVSTKGYIIIPKAIREATGIKEGDEVIIKVEGNRIITEPSKKIVMKEIDKLFERHKEEVKKYVNREVKLGELQ